MASDRPGPIRFRTMNINPIPSSRRPAELGSGVATGENVSDPPAPSEDNDDEIAKLTKEDKLLVVSKISISPIPALGPKKFLNK